MTGPALRWSSFRTPELSIQSRPSSARQALQIGFVHDLLRYSETLTAQNVAIVAAPSALAGLPGGPTAA